MGGFIKRRYHAKLLLFGEYTILMGGTAIAIPLLLFYAEWKQGATEESDRSKQSLIRLREYLFELDMQGDLLCEMDFRAWLKDMEDEWWITSTIPSGYGVGSSGAITAAVYDRYALYKETNPNKLRAILAQIESFFHGSSSGIDPLVSYLEEPVKITTENVKVLRRYPKMSGSIYLLDTAQRRRASQFIDIFNEKRQDPAYEADLEQLKQLNENCISFWETSNNPEFRMAWKKISQLQANLFYEMIPNYCRTAWKKGGASTCSYSIKLCGAGGGGFLLLHATAKFKEDMVNFDLIKIPI